MEGRCELADAPGSGELFQAAERQERAEVLRVRRFLVPREVVRVDALAGARDARAGARSSGGQAAADREPA